ncbi:uncharacterized protein LOC134531734 isoform X2 [Bacillus rossius redtenbacheri]|uniref:uncharacterized protein LOC134531734 isoform X2 n=1 Tax=Bacillus rossius redtenbacheri TaxID=93214 RepID=UPI002FDED327
MDWARCEVAVLLALLHHAVTVLSSPAPLAAIHVNYAGPAHSYSGSFYSTAEGRHFAGGSAAGGGPEAMWPVGVFLPPENWLLPPPQQRYVFPPPGGGGGGGDADPLLATGPEAAAVLRRGEMFYGRMAHARALLRFQRERRLAGLPPVRLGSNRPESPFYLWRRASPRGA